MYSIDPFVQHLIKRRIAWRVAPPPYLAVKKAISPNFGSGAILALLTRDRSLGIITEVLVCPDGR
jgi:hypothetical protein